MHILENVKQQYADDKNLSARINLHEKHSTNKQGWGAWLWEKYSFFDNCRILELGCGNGKQWEDKADNLPIGCKVTLSDFSDGMVSLVKEKYEKHRPFSFQRIDIQDIPFPGETFDIVIANHMLYYVPDLDRAFSEIKRVLKTGGKFYSSTSGNGGIRPFLHEAIKHLKPGTKAFAEELSFSLQNGHEILSAHFSVVERHDYEDSLSIAQTRDLIDWVKSSMQTKDFSEQDFDDLFEYFEDIRKREGAINIPKEGGLFISAKQT
jgi:ubiquinone/menaquinone biosynthesis C-methylase UbiE